MNNKNKNKMSKSQGNGGKPIKAPPTTTSDLTLTQNGSMVSFEVSPNAQWGGIQKFVDMTTNDGAVSVLNFNYSSPPGTGVVRSVATSGTGYYRGWTSDFNYNVHLSNVIFVP